MLAGGTEQNKWKPKRPVSLVLEKWRAARSLFGGMEKQLCFLCMLKASHTLSRYVPPCSMLRNCTWIACSAGLIATTRRSSTSTTFAASAHLYWNISKGLTQGSISPCSTSRGMSIGPRCFRWRRSSAWKGTTSELSIEIGRAVRSLKNRFCPKNGVYTPR